MPNVRILHGRSTLHGVMAEGEQAATVLIVDANPMNTLRLKELFRARGFAVEVCEDGDKAVDEYIRLDPELVVLALDLPSLDGHLAALEMREHGGDERLVFVAPRSMMGLARDAAHSAGAVAVLEKPVSRSALEDAWARILGPVPEAPGLEDLDALYPERESTAPPLPELPPLPLPPLPALPVNPAPLPVVVVDPVVASAPAKRRRRWPLLLIVFVAGGAAYAVSSGMI